MFHSSPPKARQRLSGISLIAGIMLMLLSGGISGIITGSLMQKIMLANSQNRSWLAEIWLAERFAGGRFAKHPARLMAIIAPTATQAGSQQVVQLQRQQAETAVLAEKNRLTYIAPVQFQGAVVKSGHLQVARDAIALTFDDGPWPATTQQILDILQQEGVKATFFWVGQAVQSQPGLARQVVNAGHAVGNHSWHHRYEPMDAVTAASEVDVAARIFNEITGIRTTLFRPPGGYMDNGMADYAKSQGYTIVMWSVSSADTDFSSDAQSYVNNVLSAAQPGAIVLLHDGGGNRSKTVAALPAIIRGLKAQGYRFVTIPELLKLQANNW